MREVIYEQTQWEQVYANLAIVLPARVDWSVALVSKLILLQNFFKIWDVSAKFLQILPKLNSILQSRRILHMSSELLDCRLLIAWIERTCKNSPAVNKQNNTWFCLHHPGTYGVIKRRASNAANELFEASVSREFGVCVQFKTITTVQVVRFSCSLLYSFILWQNSIVWLIFGGQPTPISHETH